MNDQDYIIEILRYFSRFVPKSLLEEMFNQPDDSRSTGYDELVAEILSQSDEYVISGITNFVVSTNKKYVSDRVKNSSGITLFVEYGQFKMDPTTDNGVTEKIGITVCTEHNIANNDNLQEVLTMNMCNNILNSILQTMSNDQDDDECGIKRLIVFPADVYPVEPEAFFDQSGWTALFNNENTML